MMASSLDQVVRELRAFEGRRAVTRTLRAALRRPVPALRRAVRARAVAILPSRGGLGAWVARLGVSAVVSLRARGASVKVKGSRKVGADKADLRALDRGRARHPSWGRRGVGQWHNQVVPDGFFSDPVADAADDWRAEVNRAADEALEVIRRGA